MSGGKVIHKKKEPPRHPVTYNQNEAELRHFVEVRAKKLQKSVAGYYKDLARADLAEEVQKDEKYQELFKLILDGYSYEQYVQERDKLLPENKKAAGG
jgi:ribosomal protein S17E